MAEVPYIPGAQVVPHRDPLIVDPLIVRGAGPSGDFVVLPWLGAAGQVTRPCNGLPTATVDVATDAGLRVNVLDEPESDYRPLLEVIDDGTLLEIRTARPDPADDAVLFRGHLAAAAYRRGGRSQTTLELEHVLKLLGEDPGRTVIGQLWAGETIAYDPAHEDPPVATVAPSWSPALPCVFNPDGVGNCRRELLPIDVVDSLTPATYRLDAFRLPVFAHTLDRAGKQEWTWARVWLHLVHRLRSDAVDWAQIGPWALYAARTIVLIETLTRYILDEQLDAIDPATSGGDPPDSDPLRAALLATPRSHAVDGMDGWAALEHTLARMGLSYAADDLPEDLCELRIFPPEGETPAGVHGGRRVVVSLPQPWRPASGGDPAGHFQVAQVAELALRTGYDAIVNSMAGLGAARQYEITVELAPLWTPDAAWDLELDSGDAGYDAALDAAIAAIGTDPWRAKYDMAAASASSYRYVGRLWGLNFWQDFPLAAPTPVRRFGPFAGVYNSSGSQVSDPGPYYRKRTLEELGCGYYGGSDEIREPVPPIFRPRRLLPCLSTYDGLFPIAPQVEVSWTGGLTWQILPGGVEIFRRDARVFLAAPSLADITIPGGTTSFAEAYVRGLLRMRVTAAIEGDDVLRPRSSAVSPESWSGRDRGRTLIRRNDWRWQQRDLGLVRPGQSQFRNAAEFPARERDDQAEMEWALHEYVRRHDRRSSSGSIEVPWLEYYGGDGAAAYGWRPGDVVGGIVSATGSADDAAWSIDLSTRQGAVPGPTISQLRWTWGPALQRTYLVLEDVGGAAQFGGDGAR